MVIESFYLPNIQYFSLITQFELITIEAYENYQKQSYRNRAKVLISNKVADLIVPVIKGNSKEIVKNIRIDQNQNWQRTHIRTLKSGYGKAPFFEFYFDYFIKAYEKKYDFLIDLNTEMLSICLQLLKLKKEIKFTETYNELVKNDFRGILHPKKEDLFPDFFENVPYNQNFGKEFVPYLSIIDAFMCQGPETLKILSQTKKMNII
jgi:hypothetical protein